MLGVSCSQNHTPVTRSGHLQGEKATAFRSYITIFSFNVHHSIKKIALWGNRPAGSRYLLLSHPSLPPPFLPHFISQPIKYKKLFITCCDY